MRSTRLSRRQDPPACCIIPGSRDFHDKRLAHRRNPCALFDPPHRHYLLQVGTQTWWNRSNTGTGANR